MEEYDSSYEGSGLELFHLSDILDLLGVSEPCMRMLIRHNLRYPDKPLASLYSIMKLDECGDDYKQHFYILLGIIVILWIIIAIASILLYLKIRRLSAIPCSASKRARGAQEELLSQEHCTACGEIIIHADTSEVPTRNKNN